MQADLGLDMVLEVFCEKGLQQLFDAIEAGNFSLPHHLNNIIINRRAYESTIDSVIEYLQNKNYTLGYRIASGTFLPQGQRFKQLDDPEWFFGHIGTHDRARYWCTMYMEDLGDVIAATVGPHFGFSKYAERIARTAVSFDPIRAELEAPTSYFDEVLIRQAQAYFEKEVPLLVGFSVPFGGNLYGALKVSQWIKAHYPQTKIALGGGYANTELRDLSDPQVFDFVDFIVLDDGEISIKALYDHIVDPSAQPFLKRTFIRKECEVKWVNTYLAGDIPQAKLPAPSYEGLRLKEYLSMFDVPNPMHRLWNDGRWNKLTIAHGCYWKKCSFCDVSLDYIARFEQSSAKVLVDKMETMIAETGETGFHFVDEAAPPVAMRDLALEILSRGLKVTWWTNIRFEKTFTEDLCRLLAASGCIAVTGGLEVASPRLLEMMEKGITIDQVARVCKGFRDAGILVHAYLMYGFPTQTDQETVDSLEIVRQLFENQLLQSAYWHRFAMTVHSPVGLNPEKYNVVRTGPEFKGFANNDLYHDDPTGADHEKYSAGLKKALYNYMHGIGFEWPLQKFFDFPVQRALVPAKLIAKSIKRSDPDQVEAPALKLFTVGVNVRLLKENGAKSDLVFVHDKGFSKIEFPTPVAKYIMDHFAAFDLSRKEWPLLKEVVTALAEIELCTPHEVVEKEWWRKWRAEGRLWLLR